jgi:hypothetical protein
VRMGISCTTATAVKRALVLAAALAVALASAGCSTSRFTYQAGSSAAGGSVTGYNATSFSAGGSRGSVAFGSPVPGGVPPATSGISGGSVSGPGGTVRGVSLGASNGAAVAILLGVGVVNLIANSFAPGRPVVTREAGVLPPGSGHLMREDPYTYPAPPEAALPSSPAMATRALAGNTTGNAVGNTVGNTRIVPRQTVDGTITEAQVAGSIGSPTSPAAVPGPGAGASVQDCTRPVDLSGGNLYCR